MRLLHLYEIQSLYLAAKGNRNRRGCMKRPEDPLFLLMAQSLYLLYLAADVVRDRKR